MVGDRERAMRSYRYRLFPNRTQETVLISTLETCRRLYNNALVERRDAWKDELRCVIYREQQDALPGNKDEYQQQVHSQVLQDVLRRLRKAFDAFFRRVRNGETPGYPRFKGKGRYDSLTYPQSGFSLSPDERRLTLSKIGSIRIELHRPLEGRVKTCTIKRDVDQWYVVFSCEVEVEARSHGGTAVGVDVGLEKFATLSDGTVIENPRFLRESERKIKKRQRRVSRRNKGSNRRKKAKKELARAHRKVRNQRTDFAHKLSRQLADNYSTITFEKLNILNMVQNHHLAKSIVDASWNTLIQYTTYKAEEAGGKVVLVDPKNTSQMCSRCGMLVKKDLSVRVHSCWNCGLAIDRDLNAALNILNRSGWGPPDAPVELETASNREAPLVVEG
ncbi:MAG: transposase [Candidatus Undinarchaeales archaeon]|jgi:putative transposase|nr:transposase [Candidatus Undinarchaeales archaeon]MDP7493350.1 transposase [Candidatus Undinarchaeales archaeon]